jgi:glycosyltransferase involved in cell wall biosynthesis
MSILEAMASGLPVVSSEAAETVIDGVTAAATSWRTRAGLASAFVWCSGQPRQGGATA